MKVARVPSELERQPRAIAIGTFDGVHLGHRAVVEAMRKSQAIAISTPPPAQMPFTAAMSGFSMASISSNSSWLART